MAAQRKDGKASKPATHLTGMQFVKVARYVEENKEALHGMTYAYSAERASKALGFDVPANRMKELYEEYGVRKAPGRGGAGNGKSHVGLHRTSLRRDINALAADLMALLTELGAQDKASPRLRAIIARTPTSEAEIKQLQGHPRGKQPEAPTLEIKRTDAAAMFKMLGFETADKWDRTHTDRNLARLKDTAPHTIPLTASGASVELYKRVMDVLDKGGTVATSRPWFDASEPLAADAD